MKKILASTAVLMMTTSVFFAGSAMAQWSLTGNAGTSASTNFLGTTDNNELVIKTNNIERMRILTGTNSPGGAIASGTNIRFGTPSVSSGVLVYSKDQAFVSFPLVLINNPSGLNWGIPNPNAGTQNTTLGRMIRFSSSDQFNSHYYDMGVDSVGSFFITEDAYANNVVPAKPFIISKVGSSNYVGINLAGTQTSAPVQNVVPTANFHTKGTVRFQDLPTGTGSILVADANGNVFRSSSTARVATDDATEIENLKKDITDLKTQIESLKKLLYEKGNITVITDNNSDKPYLAVNTPNPFNNSTKIEYYLPVTLKGAASLTVRDINGSLIKTYSLNNAGNGQVVVDNLKRSSGTYIYSLEVDGKVVDTKKMTQVK